MQCLSLPIFMMFGTFPRSILGRISLVLQIVQLEFSDNTVSFMKENPVLRKDRIIRIITLPTPDGSATPPWKPMLQKAGIEPYYASQCSSSCAFLLVLS